MLQIEKRNGVSEITNYSLIEHFKIVEFGFIRTGIQKAIQMTENVENTDEMDQTIKSNKQQY